MVFISKMFSELTPAELYEILKSRTEVFLLEQNIVCQDLDDLDYSSVHIFCEDGKKVTSYLRGFYIDNEKTTVKIGRVLTINRNKGDGRKIMEKAIDYFRKDGASEITVNAQKQAAGFYEKLNFRVCSEEFLEEGVVHIKMKLML